METKITTRPWAAIVIILGGTASLVLLLALSISVGAADIKLLTVWEAVFRFNPENAHHQIVQEIRLPRAMAGALVGAGFAVAGAMMQGMTRNPLASPGLLGVNSGAAFALAVCFAFYPNTPFHYVIMFSFVGAAAGTGIVYGIGSMAKGGLTPVRLVLAGAAVSALLSSLSEGIAIISNVAQDLAFWYAGGMSGTKWLHVKMIAPWIGGGIACALLLSRSITLLSLGDEVAAGLGQRTAAVKAAGAVVVLIIAGAAVAVVGPVGFVGLVIPHIARFLVGVDYRWVIPCSAVLGALLLVLSDIAARMVNPPFETPVGAITAIIGVPFFLYLARKGRGNS